MALGGDLHPHREASGLRQVHTAAEPPRAPQHSLAEDGLGAETPAPEEEAAETRSGTGLHLTSSGTERVCGPQFLCYGLVDGRPNHQQPLYLSPAP